MKRITLKGRPGIMAADATGIPGFGDASYVIAYPEAIGDAARATWYGDMKPTCRVNIAPPTPASAAAKQNTKVLKAATS